MCEIENAALREELIRMKREAQARDRKLVADGKLRPEDVFFIRPEMVKEAKVDWYAGSLLDEK